MTATKQCVQILVVSGVVPPCAQAKHLIVACTQAKYLESGTWTS